MKQKNIHKKTESGSAIIVVSLLILLMMVASITFLKRSNSFLSFSGIKSDVISAQYQMASAYESAMAKIEKAVAYNSVTGNGIILNGRLNYVGGPATETFNNLATAYSASQLSFLQALITQQAYNGAGTLNAGHAFRYFATAPNGTTPAFPTAWTDPDLSDDQYYQVKYTFTPIDMVTQVSPQILTFEYEYRVQVRAYGQKRFQTVGAEDAGVISISVQGAPFSQYAAFMHSMRNQNGSTLVFAGGNTSAQVQEVYSGPVHVNGTPNFYGHPTFTDTFTSGIAEASWVYYSVSGYTGCPSQCPNFVGGKEGAVPTITMPTQIFNTLRLAAGDTTTTAATNNNTVTNAELNGFLATHANGTVAAGSSALATGIYVPIDNSSSKIPTGGIYVQGDANVQMNVVQGSSDFNSTQWAQLPLAYQGCKFQKMSVSSTTVGIHARDIYVGSGSSCDVTLVYNATDATQTPVTLNGRINGNLHVNGKIDQLGGASRTRPAIAQDFGITVSALKDVRIISDLQYEDAYYVTVNASGVEGTTTVATPTGAVGGSGISPIAADLAAKIPVASHTVLGILSTSRNVMLHNSAPANINLHAAIYAGNSAAYNAGTGLGCGNAGANTQGCGFGYEGWNTNTGMGQIKFLGSLSEYKDQTTGVLSSPPRGYTSRFFYDTRLRSNITPPAFPVTNTPNAYGTIKPYKTWRISQSGN